MFEFRQPTSHRQHQTPVRRGRVRPCIAERAETGFPAGDRRERVQQVAGGSRQPVEPRHHPSRRRRRAGRVTGEAAPGRSLRVNHRCILHLYPVSFSRLIWCRVWWKAVHRYCTGNGEIAPLAVNPLLLDDIRLVKCPSPRKGSAIPRPANDGSP